MEVILGLRGNNFVLFASDCNATRSITNYKTDEDRILSIDTNKIIAATGPHGDRTLFTEYMKRNIKLYNLRQSSTMTTHAAASFTRTELATALRKNPYQINIILGGVDAPTNKAEMYYLDYLGSMHELDKAAHGYGAYYSLSIMDRYWRKDMSIEEGLDVIRKCVAQLRTRFIIQYSQFKVKVIDKDGIRELRL